MIKEFTPEILDLIKRMAAARFHARENGPKDSNDHLEAGMLASMLKAYSDWCDEQEKAQGVPAVVVNEPGNLPAVVEPPPPPVETVSGDAVEVVDPPPEPEPPEPLVVIPPPNEFKHGPG